MHVQVSNDAPLMAMVLLSYRQEDYIRESLRAAFAQTYSPLEIIVSDDASPDRTWEIIEEEAARYKGPHRFVLNRNEKNIGIVPNFLKAVSLAKAQYLIAAAGDDISEPDRVTAIAQAFYASGKNVSMVTSNASVIDSRGALMPSWKWPRDPKIDVKTVFTRGIVCLGACNAYRRDVLEKFSPPQDGIYNEDVVLTWRAAMLGRIVVLHDALVRYRIHGGNVSGNQSSPATWQGFVALQKRQAVYRGRIMRQQRDDVHWAIKTNLIEASLGETLVGLADQNFANVEMVAALFDEISIMRRLRLVLALRHYALRTRLRVFVMSAFPHLYFVIMKMFGLRR